MFNFVVFHRLKEVLPAGRSFICMDTRDLPTACCMYLCNLIGPRSIAWFVYIYCICLLSVTVKNETKIATVHPQLSELFAHPNNLQMHCIVTAKNLQRSTSQDLLKS